MALLFEAAKYLLCDDVTYRMCIYSRISNSVVYLCYIQYFLIIFLAYIVYFLYTIKAQDSESCSLEVST